MSCLGLHFALNEKEVAHLRSLDDEQARLEHLQEVIEEHYLNHEKQFAAESDKSWDAMHRALADGRLTWDGGEYVLDGRMESARDCIALCEGLQLIATDLPTAAHNEAAKELVNSSSFKNLYLNSADQQEMAKLLLAQGEVLNSHANH